MQIGWIQIIMAVLYLCVLIGIGLYMSKKVKSSEDFWVGGRGVGPVATALSYCAAYVSTVAIIGDPPMYYNYGYGYAGFEMATSVFFVCVLIFVVLAPKMRAISERLQVVSLSGFMAVRYKSNGFRLLCGILVAVMMIPYAISAMNGIANAMTSIAGIPYAVGVFIIAAVVFFYLVTAGYWGVSTTDIIQGITIAISCIIVGIVVTVKAGGVTNIISTMGSSRPEFITPSSGMTFGTLFGWAGVWALIAFGQPQLITKFMGLKDSRTIKTVMRTSVIWEIIFMISIILMGGAAFTLYGGQPFENGDMIVPTLVADHTGTLLQGFFICGILAAGLSTVCALILTSAGAVAKDIYEDYSSIKNGKIADPSKSIRISRIVTAVVLVIVILGAIYPPDFIWSLSTMSAGVMGASFTAPLLLGLYWKKATKKGCYAAVIGGSIVSIAWYLMGLTSITHSFVPGTVVSFILLVVVSLIKPEDDQDLIDVFFEPGCSQAKIDKVIAYGNLK